MIDNVVSMTGKKPEVSKEREFVEYFAQRLRSYVDEYGHMPETVVFAMWGSDSSEGTDWATSFVAEPPKSKVEAQSMAAGLLLTKGL